MDKFWKAIGDQLEELKSAGSADDVIRILSHERNPDKYALPDGVADGFFSGSGSGGETVWDALDDAGWMTQWMRAQYWWCMKAPDGSMVTYIEGDVYRGNRR